MKKITLGLLQVLLLLFLPLGSMAQNEENSDAEQLQELLQSLDKGIAYVKALSSKLDAVPQADQEAIRLRRDQRSFTLVQELDRLARLAARLPENEPQRQEMTRRLLEDYAGVPDIMFNRIEELSGRIATFSAERETLSGTPSLAMEAYIYTLKTLRIQAYEAVADIIDSRKALGLPVDTIVQQLSDRLYLHAEILAGHLQFTGTASEELQARLDGDPANTELDAAVKAFATRHTIDLHRLETISGLLGRLELENGVYKAVLLQQGQDISIRDFESDLFFNLLRGGLSDLKELLIEKAPDILFRLVIFVLVLLGFRILSRLTRRGVIAACERSSVDMSTLLKDVLASVSGGTVMVLGILMALSQVGISLGPMLAGLGVAGFIVGFALQDTLGNFAAGGMILIYRPYDVDDFVEIAGASGLVKKMSLVSTTINTFDNQTLVVPNSKIWGDVIKNVTAQRIRRVDLEFGIGYSDDIEHAETVLKDILEQHDMVLSKPESMIKLHTLADSSVNFIVRPWVKTGDYWDVYWDITREVKMRFDREGISIPFPQRDVHFYQEQEQEQEQG